MSNVVTESNPNPVVFPSRTNVALATVFLEISGHSAHEVFVAGQFSADCSGGARGNVEAAIFVDNSLRLNTQIDEVNGEAGTMLCLSGALALLPGQHELRLNAAAENIRSVSAHHRSLSVIDLDADRESKCNWVDITDPRFAARGDGVTDDKNAIQAAIDSLPPTGGTVYFPLIKCAPTTYIIGKPGVPTSPLKYPSNVAFVGDYFPGVGRSTVKLCDNFHQVIFGADSDPATSPFWQSCVFAPACSSRFWGPYGPGVPDQVTNVTFRDLAIDGNRNNQPLLYIRSNHGLVPDAFQGLSVTAVEGPSTLTAGTYQFFVTYTDAHGVETNVEAATEGSVTIVPGEFARIALNPTPLGAVQMYAYVSRSEMDAYRLPGWWIYERQGPFAIPAEGSLLICDQYHVGGNLDINSHVLGSEFPPGLGIRILPTESATGAICIDSNTAPGTSPTSNFILENCDIGNMASDALTMAVGFIQNLRVNKCGFHDLGLIALDTAPDLINGLYVTDTDFFNCALGADFEPNTNNVVSLVRFTGCAFNNGGFGISLGATYSQHISDFVIENCQFGNTAPNTTNLHLWSGGPGGRADSVHIKNCYFGYSHGAPTFISASGNGTIADCFFDQTSRPHCYDPGEFYALDAPQIIFDGGQSGVGDIGPAGSNWQVLGCTFKPFANATLATSQPCIQARNGSKNIYVSGCVYLHNDTQGTAPSGSGQLLFESDVLGGLANHRFAANSGVLGEAGVPAVGYPVGPFDTSIAIVFPTPQTTLQYEACPQFGWDSGNWWVTDKTDAGYTLHWKNAPGSATQLSITIRDSQA